MEDHISLAEVFRQKDAEESARIASLRAELARVREERDRLKEACLLLMHAEDQSEDELAALIEIGRLVGTITSGDADEDATPAASGGGGEG